MHTAWTWYLTNKFILPIKKTTMTWWILFGVAITFLTLILAGAFKKKN